MSGMEYGTDEHLDGLSRDALKSEVRWWHGRALEMEAENAKLRELLAELYESAWLEYPSAFEHTFAERLRELGVEV